MARIITILTTFASFAATVHSMPAINSTTLHQNALNAQILNSEFLQLRVEDACNSGRAACINGTMAVCQFGSWQTSDCGSSKECFALPSTTAPGTNLVCTSQASAMSAFQAAGVDGLLSNGTDAVAFPTVTSQSSIPASSATPPPTSPSSSAASASDDVDVVTVTVTVPISTQLPTETRTIDPAEAASILASISAQNRAEASLTASSVMSSTHSMSCQQPSATASSSTVPPQVTGYTRRGQALRRA